MASKFNTGYSGFTDSVDAFMGNTPVLNKIGTEGRTDRNLDRQGRRVEVADNTATEVGVVPAILQKEKQALIGYMPVEKVNELDKPSQAKVFELNFKNKGEKATEELQKDAFEKIKAAGEKQLEAFKVPATDGKIANVRELANPSTVKSFDVKDVFTPAEVAKIINLDAANPGRYEGGVLQNDLSPNIDALAKGIFGDALVNHIDGMIDDRFGSSDDIKTAISEYIQQNGVGPATDAEMKLLVADSIKVALLRDPSAAKDIITKLANNGQIDLATIPGFQDTLKERVVKDIVDRMANRDQAYFNPAMAGGPSAQQEIENRKKVAAQLLTGATTGAIVLSKAGATANVSVKHLASITTTTPPATGPVLPILATGNPIILDAKSAAATAPDAAALSSNKNDAFKGLAERFTNADVKKFVKNISKALTRNPATAKDIYTNVFNEVIGNGGDATKDKLKRYEGFAKAYKYITENKATAANPSSLETLQTTVEEFALPEKILANTQKALLDSVVSIVTSLSPRPPELASLNTTNLADEIKNALAGKTINPALLERLSLITAGINDKDKRAEAISALRAVANLEVVKSIAREAAGGDSSPKYQQYLMALTNRFIFRDSGDPANPVASAELVSKQLMDLLYAEDKDKAITSINIIGNNGLKDYLKALLPNSVAIEQKLELKGMASTGDAYKTAHELFGIVRRGQEAGELVALKGMTPQQKEAFLVSTYGFEADSDALKDALTRLDEVLSATAPTDGSMNLTQLVDAAAAGKSTDFGLKYSNIVRMYRHYIENGGKLVDIMRNAEILQANSYLNAIQNQANAQTGARKGGLMTEGNRVLTVEEQRSAILEDYKALGAKSGIRGWFERIKRVMPRIGKAVGFMALTTAASMIPVAGGLVAAGLVVARVASAIGAVKMGVPLFKQAWKDGNWKAGVAAGLAIGVNVAVNTLVPSPLNFGLTLIGETLATEVYADRQLSKEVKTLKKAYDNYDTALGNMLANLDMTKPEDQAFLKNSAKAVNVDVQMNGTDIDHGATVTEIINARNAAHTEKNMTKLRAFGEVVETRMTTEISKLDNENIKAKRSYEESQQTIMAYSVAAGATKLGFAAGRGWEAGYERGGVFGGLAGALGWGVGMGAETEGNTLDKETSEKVTLLQRELEEDFDERATQLGVSSGGTNVVGLVHTSNGDHVALIDMDGDPSTAEMIVDVDKLSIDNPGNADLDFGEAAITKVSADLESVKTQIAMLTNTPMNSISIAAVPEDADDSILSILKAGNQSFAVASDGSGGLGLYQVTMEASGTGGGSETITSLDQIVAKAEPGDSQWTLVSDVIKAGHPSITEGELNNATANALAEAGTGKVYEEIYENRTKLGMGGGSAVAVNDEFTLAQLKEIAPNTYESIVATTGEAQVDVATGGAGGFTNMTLGQRVDIAPAEIGNGMLVFSPDGNHMMIGEMPLNGNDLNDQTNYGGTGGAGGTPVTEEAATETAQNQPGWLANEWSKFTTAMNTPVSSNPQTDDSQNIASVSPAGGTGGAGGVTPPSSEMTTDTFMVQDPALGNKFPIYEDTVAKIIIPQDRLAGAPALEIDPGKVDVISVSNDSVTYMNANGVKETIPATNGVQLAFVGNEQNPVDIATGQQNILTMVNDATRAIADGITYANSFYNDQATQINRIASGAGEVIDTVHSAITQIGEPVYDPGFTNQELSEIGNTTITHLGPDSNPYVTSDTSSPAWLYGFAVENTNGDGNTVIPIENIYRVGEDYIQYKDISTNDVVTVKGENIYGVGFTYEQVGDDQKLNTKQAYTWDFLPENPGQPAIERAENPWWIDQVNVPSR